MNNDLIIDVKNLKKSFDHKEVVHGIDLQVRRGEVCGFLGPNGSGKTTTIRMICGLLTPNDGEGHCLGYDVIRESELIKQKIGYMTQKFSLYEDLSVYENLDFIARAYHLKNAKQSIDATLDRLNFTKARRHQIVGELSGGWKQRLALAAALIHDPKLLLLDEPTAGVDPKARREFWDHIHKLAAEGVTTLVSTHYMDEAERCHRLAYIAYGKLLTTGTLTDIIEAANLVTWHVTGDALMALSEQLQQEPAVEQIAPFGQVLHVIGSNIEALKKISEKYRSATVNWQPAKVSLEDVFISLVAQAKDGYS